MTYEYFTTEAEALERVAFHKSRNRCAYALALRDDHFEVRYWH
jgi:hypothetical protein